MKGAYLEVTYRKGQVLAAYYYLPRQEGDSSARTDLAGPGLVVDYSHDDRPIGVEITSPGSVQLSQLNALLEKLGQQPLQQEEFAPLVAA